MKLKTITGPIIAVCLSLLQYCINNIAGNTSEVGNATLAGVFYEPDGVTPAAGVRVHIRPKNSLPDTSGAGLIKRLASLTAVDSVTTDSAGRFAFDSTLDTGTYVITSASGNNAVLIDSVKVTNRDSTDTLPPDTLKSAGTLKGIIKLSEGGDTRKVFILVFGIDRLARVEADGTFKFQNLAEARYNLRIISSLDDYGVLDTNAISVRSKDTTDLDTIDLPFTGIPTPKNVTIRYDTMMQIVTLMWDKANTSLVSSYHIYRRNVGLNTVLTRINTSLVTGTVYRDSTGVQDSTYEYSVAAVDAQNTTGLMSAGNNIRLVSSVKLVNSVPRLKPMDRFAIGSDSMFYSVYIGDNFIRVFNKSGDSVGIIGSGDLSNASDIAIDSHNHIYAVASNGIFKYSSNGLPLNHWTTTEPSRATIDENDFLYIIYNNRHSIARVDTAGTFLDSATVQGADEIVSVVTNGIFVGDGECDCVRIFDTNLVQRSTIELQFQVDGHSSYNILAADATGRLYVREMVSFGSQGIVEIHIFDLQGNHIGKFQPIGGNDLSVSGNTLYLIDREQGLSTYRLPF